MDRPWNTPKQDDAWEAYAEWEAWIIEQFPQFPDVISEWEDNVASWLKPHIYGVCCDIFDNQAAEIKRLKDAIEQCLTDNAHLADGDDCTLYNLKQALKGTE